MVQKPSTTAPPIGIVPDVPTKDVDLTGSASTSETNIPRYNTTGKNRDGVTFAGRDLGSDHYEPIDSYEGKHRYDPNFDWEPEEERRVVRKVWEPRPYMSVAKLTLPRLTRESVLGFA